jgi:hypothetical protein
MRNWFNIESHPTDEYIHWAEANPIKLASRLRPCYDLIQTAGLGGELKNLLDAAYEAGSNDEHDSNSEDL